MEQNKAKKSKKGFVLLALLLAVLFAVGAVAGTTLAKYISDASIPSTTATVAKWGYTITADAGDLFGKTYGGEFEDDLAIVSEDDTIAVSSELIVAPGTKGSLTVTINGSAEVNAVLTISLKEFETIVLTDGEEGSFEYYPILWTLGGEELNEDNETSLSKSDLGDAIVEAIEAEVEGDAINDDDAEEDVSAIYNEDDDAVYIFLPAGTVIEDLELELGWSWIFDNTDTDESYDIYDTILGYLANGEGDLDIDDLSENIQAWLEENALEAGYSVDDEDEEPDAEAFLAAIVENSKYQIELELKITVEQTLIATASDFESEYNA